MGIVQRQGLKFSLVNFAGLAVSLVATIWLYPRVQAEYGLVGFLTTASLLTLPLATLGVNQLSIRFFPRFEEKSRQHNGFLLLLVGWVAMGCATVAVAAALFKPLISSVLQGREAMLRDHFWWLLPLVVLQAFAVVLAQYTMNFGRAAVPSLFTDFLIKISVPIGLLGVWRGWWPIEAALAGLILNYAAAILGLVFYLKSIGEFHTDRAFLRPSRELLREVASFAGFGVALNVAMFLVTRLDLLMVTWLMSLQKGGVYTIAAYIASVMDVPGRAVITVAMPLISRYWNDNKRLEINSLYQKSSINLLIVGTAIYGATLVSLSSLLRLMPNSEQMLAGQAVVVVLGAAKLFDLATGLNGYILLLSKKHWSFFWSVGALAFAGVALNLWLIPRLGLTGAALATMGGVMAYNTANSVLVWRRFGMQPFSKNTLLALAFGLAAGLVAWLLPASNLLIVNVLWKSGSFLGLFLTAVLWASLSPDLNDFCKKLRAGKLW